jgi:hypothetical protein
MPFAYSSLLPFLSTWRLLISFLVCCFHAACP